MKNIIKGIGKAFIKIVLLICAFIAVVYGLICLAGMRSGYEAGLVVQMIASFALASALIWSEKYF